MLASKKGRKIFFETLRQDDLVADYEKYATQISEAMTPMDHDATILGKLVQPGDFPVITHVGGGTMVVLHHFTNTSVNNITGETKNAKGISGIHLDGNPGGI